MAVSNDTAVKKELPAVKTEHPPTIDGVLDDKCWQDAPKRIPSSMNVPKSRRKTNLWDIWFIQTPPFMLGCISTMICPIKLSPVKPKIRPGFKAKTRYPFSLDPFHTHQFSDRNFFIVNPLGTKYAHLATGRAEKSEWIGLWKTAAQIVENGWIVEMEIPWQMLDYPETTRTHRDGYQHQSLPAADRRKNRGGLI